MVDYQNIKNITEIPKDTLIELFPKDLYDLSKKYKKFETFITLFRNFKKEFKLCKNCKDFYSRKLKECPNSSCFEYNFKRKQNILNKQKQTKLEKYGNPTYNNPKKISVSYTNKTQEEKDLISKRKSETLKIKCNPEKGRQTKLERYGNPNYQNIEKIKQTKLEKYGNPNYVNVEKRKLTNLKKYGVEYGFQNAGIKEKIKQSNLEKYGVENISQCENIKKKKIEKSLEKYGVQNPSLSPEIQEKIRDTNLKKYGVLHPMYSPEFKDKLKQTNLEKYGVKSSLLSPDIKKLDNPGTILKNLENYNNKEYWTKTFLKDGFVVIEEIESHFGITTSVVYRKLKELNIQYLTKPKKLKTQMNIFNSIQCENKILNDRKVLNGKEIDIFLPDYKLGIEYNGLMFHSQGVSKYSMLNTPDYNKNYHLEKLENCIDKGITLYTIFEGENLDLWLSMINNKLKLNTKVYARDCFVKELSNKEVKDFLNDNHIQGFVNSRIVLGLFINQNKENSYNFTKVKNKENPILVSVMTFSKPRFNKKYDYELIRFCSLKGYSIIGGASKLFKFFLRNYEAKKIISYANRRFSQGNIYEVLGFKKIGVSTPNYFYFKEDDFTLYSRVKFQKHKLSKILPNYNKNLTESENMFNNGYRRIFDCGNLIYEFNL